MSSGAVLALHAAAANLPVTRLALYEPPFLVDDTRTPPPPDFLDRVRGHIADDDRGAAVRQYMTEGMGVPAFFVAAMRLTPMWSRAKAIAHTLPYDWELLDGTLTGQPLGADPWGSVTAPTLVMAGAKSPQQLRSAAAGLAGVLPNTTHWELAGQNHNPSMKAVAPIVDKFLATSNGSQPRVGLHGAA